MEIAPCQLARRWSPGLRRQARSATLEKPSKRNPFTSMKTLFKLIMFNVAIITASSVAHAGFFDQLKSTLTTSNSAAAAVSSLPEDQIAAGLKEALGQGVSNAVASLGRNNGFLTNVNAKIPLPEKLQQVEKALRMAGESQLADQFIASMNHAAEQAVPVAAGVFGDAIQQMSIADAKGILAGPDDSATKYFQKTTQTNLFAKFYPLVQKATDSVGVTAEYKAMMDKFTSVNTFGSLLGKSNPVNLNTADIDTYVTDKAMDGLFKMVADEEKNIRANPVARTSDLLQKVFGSATK
jgi:hypothetical protein